MSNKKLRYDIIARENLSKFVNVAGSALKGFGRLAGGVMRSLTSLPSILAGGSLVGGMGAAVKKAFDFEAMETSIATILKDGEKAKKVFNDMMDFSDATPFGAEEVANAGKMLISFGMDAEKVQDQLRMIGDVAAGAQIPLEELAEIYGKAMVQGRLYGEDVNQLLGRGIPVYNALGKALGKNANEIKKMVSEGKIGFRELEMAFGSLTGAGGMYDGMMEKLSQTGHGMFSTLKGTWTRSVADFGRAFMDLSKGAIGDLTEKLKQLRSDGSIEKWAKSGAQAVETLGGVLGDLFDDKKRGQALNDIGAVVGAVFADGGDLLKNGIKEGAKWAARELRSAILGDKVAKRGVHTRGAAGINRGPVDISSLDSSQSAAADTPFARTQAALAGLSNRRQKPDENWLFKNLDLDRIVQGGMSAGNRLADHIMRGGATSESQLAGRFKDGQQVMLGDIFTQISDQKRMEQKKLGTTAKPMVCTVIEMRKKAT